jgi:hypothetical protein
MNPLARWTTRHVTFACAIVALFFFGLASAQRASADVQGLYWTDHNGGTIQRSNLDGTGVQTLVSGLTQPDGLAYDAARGKMYWIDGGIFPRINSANLDGSSRSTLFSIPYTSPQKLAFDPVASQFFWTAHPSGGPTGLMRADLDGSNATQIITGQSAPESVSVDSVNRKVYWTDIIRQTVSLANLDGTGAQDIITDPLHTGGIQGVVADPANNFIFFGASTGTDYSTSPPTTTGGVQRAGLDGSAITELLAVSSTYQALAVDDAALKVYWADSQSHSIKSSNFDGTGLTTIQSGVSFQPYGLVMAPVPEPASLGVLGVGAMLLVAGRLRRSRHAPLAGGGRMGG